MARQFSKKPKGSFKGRGKGSKKFGVLPSKSLTTTKFSSKVNSFGQLNPYGVKAEPFPKVMYTRVKYSDETILSASVADTATARLYRLNSIYDPNFTIVGGDRTCAAHAQLAAIYSQYWVLGAKVRVSFSDPSADGLRVGCRLMMNGANTPQNETLQELTETPLTYVAGLNNTGGQNKNFNFFVRPWTLMGVSKLEYMANSSAYSSFMSGSPATGDNCLIGLFMNEPYASGHTVKVVIQITYYVKFFSRIDNRSTYIPTV